MKILETGSRGMVCVALKEVIRDHDLIVPQKHKLNVGNMGQVMSYLKCGADAVIHMAAETDHEY
jgi:dTDP-4-dehydrorhamnose reductase